MAQDERSAPPPPGGEIATVSLVEEMRSSYLDYAMSVIVARALPDVRDGLKPVHRRILWAAFENGFTHDRPFRKSARIVGDVVGKYHPHGDAAVYDALARMAQDWSMRLPLIDGQGNFGSMDPDPPAAMRYTEARLSRAAEYLLADIEADTVDFQPNYDGQEREPTVLPARIPNLLVNGAGGIAVGMATNIPPHNLGEVVDACLALLDDPELDDAGLMERVPGPDFPTGGLILRTPGLVQAMTTGRGSVVVRARHVHETAGGAHRIVLTEIPFQQGKAALVERIAEAIRDRRIEGVADLRDESSREGVRIVLDLKRDAVPDVVANQLFRHTPAQTTFAVHMLALQGGRPEQLSLRALILSFLAFRRQVVARRSRFELGKARERAHLLVGLALAVAHLDEVVALIRASASPGEARAALLAREWPAASVAPYLALVEAEAADFAPTTVRLSPAQVQAILDLRLHRLTALGREEIADELRGLSARIQELLAILADRARLEAVVRAELEEVRALFATPRRTTIVEAEDLDDEDLIAREDMVVTVTQAGWIKRVGLDSYRAQRRGGRGRTGMATREEDWVTDLFVASTHAPVLFFSSRGRVYRLKVWRLPEGLPQARGRAMVNLLPLEPGETIAAVLPLPEDEARWADLNVMFATARGLVRRNRMDAFARIPAGGKLAIRFEDGTEDRLVGVALCHDDEDVLLATRRGKAIRFEVTAVRAFQSRTSTGVRGIELDAGDEVISLSMLRRVGTTTEEREAYLRAAPWKGAPPPPDRPPERFRLMAEREQFILTVTAGGYGKRSSAYEYRRTHRGGKGIVAIDVASREDEVVAAFPVAATEQIMLATDRGRLIRMPSSDIRIAGRATMGVILVRLEEGERVVSAARIREADDAPAPVEDRLTP
ncbi:MAG: DNA gyrase subunit A [Sphingomonadaceae bacterium]|uniref:DNA gyrase subunit A n=1 Tax=Thermaurantiacus sp. TaxID=2820283 RepID=UPI00298F1406|nr:DNA gyrase subunit A [Thermaurantiacus sp.]MCS6987450.1 DNA gyrase subunit A [Sphingomonadaceae bacterium]MDW8415370.1 DNA gyrase subunit A [Thermaurantiacus sp.]